VPGCQPATARFYNPLPDLCGVPVPGRSIDPMACAGAAQKVSAVLYHYPCPDGAFAALAAHLYFSGAAHPVRFFPNTVYDPIRYHDPLFRSEVAIHCEL
jgi:hypothetical protein